MSTATATCDCTQKRQYVSYQTRPIAGIPIVRKTWRCFGCGRERAMGFVKPRLMVTADRWWKAAVRWLLEPTNEGTGQAPSLLHLECERRDALVKRRLYAAWLVGMSVLVVVILAIGVVTA